MRGKLILVGRLARSTTLARGIFLGTGVDNDAML